MTTWSSSEYVQWLYRSLLGREPDPDGLGHFSHLLDSGVALKWIVDAILESDEYKTRSKVEERDPLQLALLQRRKLVIVDVGARLLEDESHIYAPLTTSDFDWHCIGFEPQKHRLAERAAAEPDARLELLDAFIGDGAQAQFYTVNEDGSSSIFPLNLPFNADFDDISTMRIAGSETVNTVTLDDVLAARDYVDLLKFDIQGAEGKALQGATELLKRTNVIHCEVFFAPMYHGTPHFSEIELFLRQHGFEFIDFHYLNRYKYVNVPHRQDRGERLIWGDAVFFNSNVTERDSLVSQAIIASFIYRKHGLAQTLLRKLRR